MTGQYLGNDLQWRPIATVTGGGGPVEKLPLSLVPGSVYGASITLAGDEIWDVLEPQAVGTSLAYAFYRMSNITMVPAMDTSSVVTMTSMFNGCTSLTEVPALDMSGVRQTASFNNAFGAAGNTTSNKATQLQSCTRFRAYGARYGFAINGTQMDAAALDELMANLGTAFMTQTLDIRYNPGSATCDPSIAEAKGWTVLV